jgi:hypothetical protein
MLPGVSVDLAHAHGVTSGTSTLAHAAAIKDICGVNYLKHCLTDSAHLYSQTTNTRNEGSAMQNASETSGRDARGFLREVRPIPGMAILQSESSRSRAIPSSMKFGKTELQNRHSGELVAGEPHVFR